MNVGVGHEAAGDIRRRFVPHSWMAAPAAGDIRVFVTAFVDGRFYANRLRKITCIDTDPMMIRP